MTSPVLRDKSSVRYIRKAVPKDLQDIVGKKEIKVSLRTKDPELAEIRNRELDYKWNENFASLRMGKIELTHQQRVAMAGVFYKDHVERHREEPGERADVGFRIHWDAIAADDPNIVILKAGKPEITDRLHARLRDRHRCALRDFLIDQGLLLEPSQFEQVLFHVNRAMYRASLRIKRFYDGDYAEDPADSAYPPFTKPMPKGSDGRPLVPKEFDIVEVYEGYASQQEHSESTLTKYRAILRQVATEHRDIRNITREWCIQWRETLLAKGLSTATVKKAYLSVLNTVCAEAVNLGRIASNPAEALRLRVRKPVRYRADPGYSDSEAAIVLTASLGPMSDALPPDRKRARRWLPWLSCYTGARIGELAQARGRDVIEDAGYWFLEITPDAGPVKDRKPRRVPLHSHVLEQGFLDMVRDVGDGHLFLDLARLTSSSAKVGRQTAEHIGEWVRSLGVDDPELQPTHGWRHRLATLRRESGMPQEMANYIMGHVPVGEGQRYGRWRPEALGRGILTMPRIDPVDGTPSWVDTLTWAEATDLQRLPASVGSL